MQPGEEGVNCQSKCSCARGNTAENVCDRRVSSGNSHKFADFRRFRKKLSKTPCIFPEMWYNRFRSEARAKRNRVEDVWGISAVGSAFEWHSKGQGFDSPMLHHKGIKQTLFLQRWLCHRGLALIPHRKKGVVFYSLFCYNLLKRGFVYGNTIQPFQKGYSATISCC